MNDVERRLRDFGEEADGEVANELWPRPASLRRIRRRRFVASTSVLACAATIVAAGAFTWTARDAGDRAQVPPAGDPRLVEVVTGCDWIAFEPTYVPPGFDREWQVPRDARPGVIRALYRGKANAIEVTRDSGAFVQTRPRPVEVLGRRGTIGMIHEGWSLELRHRACDYTLYAYGVTRPELHRFAKGLRADSSDTLDRHFATIWPPEDLSDPEGSCSIDMTARVEASQVAEDFLRTELGWIDPILVPPDSRSDVWLATRAAPDAYDYPPRIELIMRELGPRCWAVVAAGEFGADRMPRGFDVAVEGRRVYVDYAPLDAVEVIADVRYVDRPPVRQTLDQPAKGPAEVDLGFRPAEPGRILLLFLDEDGNVFTAIGLSLPSGDYRS